MSTHAAKQGSPKALFLSLAALGLEVSPNGDRITVRGLNQLPERHADELRVRIRANKPELLRLLLCKCDPSAAAVREEATA